MNRRRFLQFLGLSVAAVAVAPLLPMIEATPAASLTTMTVSGPGFAVGNPIIFPRTGEVLRIVAVKTGGTRITVSGRIPKIVRNALVDDDLVIL